MLLVQFFTVLGFGAIAFQDVKERLVHWVLFPIVGILLGILHLKHVELSVFLLSCITNVIFVSALISLLFLYTKLLTKKKFLNTSFGLGDILFFYAFAFGFPTLTFLVLFSLSICFSLLGFTILNYFFKSETVPLAGLMGMFLGIVFLWNLVSNSFSLYLM